MHAAEEQSGACGDGTFEETWEDEELVGKQYTGLEVCANDEDFGLVSMKLGLDPRIGWGPYLFDVDGEDIGMVMDSDSD